MKPKKSIPKLLLMVVASLVFTVLMTGPAMAEYANTSVTNTNDPVYWLDLGGFYATYGSYQAAIKAYDKALALDPDNSLAYFNRGLSYAEIDELDQALADMDKAIALNPAQDNYYYARGRVLLLIGDMDRAMKDFRKAAAMGDKDAIGFLKGLE